MKYEAARSLIQQKPPPVQNRRGQKRLIHKLRLAGSDQAHLVDFVSVAATGQVVDGCVQALQNGAVGSVAAQTLSDLIADVAGLDAGEDEGVGPMP